MPSKGLVSESGRVWKTPGLALAKTSSLLERRSSRLGRSSGESACDCASCGGAIVMHAARENGCHSTQFQRVGVGASGRGVAPRRFTGGSHPARASPGALSRVAPLETICCIHGPHQARRNGPARRLGFPYACHTHTLGRNSRVTARPSLRGTYQMLCKKHNKTQVIHGEQKTHTYSTELLSASPPPNCGPSQKPSTVLCPTSSKRTTAGCSRHLRVQSHLLSLPAWVATRPPFAHRCPERTSRSCHR